MEIKQPSATFPGFRHIHRALLPGETIPKVPTLVEQLQALSRSSAGTIAVAADEAQAPESDEGDEERDEEWTEA